MKTAPAGITGSFSMLFLMVFGRYPEKFSLGIFFPLQPVYRSNTIRLLFVFIKHLKEDTERLMMNGKHRFNPGI